MFTLNLPKIESMCMVESPPQQKKNASLIYLIKYTLFQDDDDDVTHDVARQVVEASDPFWLLASLCNRAIFNDNDLYSIDHIRTNLMDSDFFYSTDNRHGWSP